MFSVLSPVSFTTLLIVFFFWILKERRVSIIKIIFQIVDLNPWYKTQRAPTFWSNSSVRIDLFVFMLKDSLSAVTFSSSVLGFELFCVCFFFLFSSNAVHETLIRVRALRALPPHWCSQLDGYGIVTSSILVTHEVQKNRHWVFTFKHNFQSSPNLVL